ncbi:MAG: hypothetical protein ACHRXM_07250 [Isosphaerales bacterium]
MSSVASLQPPAVVFREEQYFDWRVYALIALVGLATGLGLVRGRVWSLEVALGLLIGLALLMFVIVFLLHMTTEVSPTDLRVWFGWAPTSPRIVPVGTVRSIEVVTYRPFADYGFWGIRSGRDGERALVARGNRGVRLELTDGTRLLIGSQRPEALATALDCALRPGV